MRISFSPLFFIIASVFLASCRSGDHGSGENVAAFSGGNKVIRIAEVTAPMSIFPHKLTNVVEGLIASQIHEGLVRINPKDLSVVPGLAESWEIAPNGKTITFHLRQGVKFQ